MLKAGEIENYLGYALVDGIAFVEKMLDQMRRLGVEPIVDEVVEVKREEEGFRVKTASGKEFYTNTVLFCTGAEHRRLGVPGEREYTGRGVSYCYTCDAPFFKDAKVVVVGGGNSGFEAADQLTNYAKEIYLVEISDQFRADEVLKEKVLSNPKVKTLLRHRVLEIRGDGKEVRSVVLEDLRENKIFELEVEGVFVEVGLKPNSELAKSLGVLTTQRDEIIIDCNNRTSSSTSTLSSMILRASSGILPSLCHALHTDSSTLSHSLNLLRSDHISPNSFLVYLSIILLLQVFQRCYLSQSFLHQGL